MDTIILPVGKYFNKINPNTNKILMRDSYNEYIKRDEFKKAVTGGYIKLYATEPPDLLNNDKIPSEFIFRYCIGDVINVDENNIEVDISTTIYHNIVADKCTVSKYYPDGLYAALNTLIEPIPGYSNKVNIWGLYGFTLHLNKTDRSLPDLLFQMGSVYERNEHKRALRGIVYEKERIN